MEIQTIKEIVGLMKDNDLSEFEMEAEGLRLSIKRGRAEEPRVVVAPMAAAPSAASAVPSAAAPAPSAAASVQEESAGTPIKSPIVGTFYRSSSPDTEPFVTVGQAVEPDTVVCIIEAMKVMNEIKAETRGVVKRILVDNATAVQYGQTLMLVEPA